MWMPVDHLSIPPFCRKISLTCGGMAPPPLPPAQLCPACRPTSGGGVSAIVTTWSPESPHVIGYLQTRIFLTSVLYITRHWRFALLTDHPSNTEVLIFQIRTLTLHVTNLREQFSSCLLWTHNNLTWPVCFTSWCWLYWLTFGTSISQTMSSELEEAVRLVWLSPAPIVQPLSTESMLFTSEPGETDTHSLFTRCETSEQQQQPAALDRKSPVRFTVPPNQVLIFHPKFTQTPCWSLLHTLFHCLHANFCAIWGHSILEK